MPLSNGFVSNERFDENGNIISVGSPHPLGSPTGILGPNYPGYGTTYNTPPATVTNPFAIGMPGSSNAFFQQNGFTTPPQGPAPTSAQVAANLGGYTGTSWDPSRSLNYTAPQNIQGSGGTSDMRGAAEEMRRIQREGMLQNILSNPQQTIARLFTFATQGATTNGAPSYLAGGSNNSPFNPEQYLDTLFGAGASELASNPQVRALLDQAKRTYTEFRQANPNAGIRGFGSELPSGSGPQQQTFGYNPSTGRMELMWNTNNPGSYPGQLGQHGFGTGAFAPGNTGGTNANTNTSTGGNPNVPNTPATTTVGANLAALTGGVLQYSDAIDNMLRGELPPNLRGLPGTDPRVRQALDALRLENRFPSYTQLQQNSAHAQNFTSPRDWFAGGSYGNAPFLPNADPGQYWDYQWNDLDGNGPDPGNWGLTMAANPRTYAELQAAMGGLSNPGLANKRIIGNPYIIGDQTNPQAIAPELFPFAGNSAWQRYNSSINDYLRGGLDERFQDPMSSNFGNSAFANEFMSAMNDYRSQNYFPTMQELQSMSSQTGTPNLANFANLPNGVPFTPRANPFQGFEWEWMDPDGQGANPGLWSQQLVNAPTTYDQAYGIANSLNNAPTGSSMLGLMLPSSMFTTNRANGRTTYTANQSYFNNQTGAGSGGYNGGNGNAGTPTFMNNPGLGSNNNSYFNNNNNNNNNNSGGTNTQTNPWTAFNNSITQGRRPTAPSNYGYGF